MKKLVLLLVTILIIFMTGCKSTESNVPFILYDEEDLFMSEFKNAINRLDQGDISIEIYDSKNSQIIQNEIINSVLDENPSLMIINSVDRMGAYTIIEKLKASNTPIIFTNREPLEEDLFSWEHVYYVGAKAEQSAKLQAELVMELFGNNPNSLNQYDKNGDGEIQIIILKGQEGHQDAEIRTEVVVNELEINGFVLDVLEIKSADFRTNVAYEIMKDLLIIYRDIVEVIISNNDAMAIGAINALIDDGFFPDLDQDGEVDSKTENWLPVIGIDGIDEAIPLIENGYLYGTVVNDSESMAKAVIELANAIINNTDLKTLSYSLDSSKYIWIDYEKYSVPISDTD